MLNYPFLSAEEKSVFDTIRMQAERCDGKFRVTYTKRIRDILRAMKYDCPETFSVNWHEYSWMEYKQKNLIKVTYTPTCDITTYKEVLNKTDRLLPLIKGKTEWEKVKQVHDVIIWMSNYDTDYIDAKKTDPKRYNPYRHSIYGIIMEGLTVCEGVAQLMNYLLNRLGVFCCVVCGDIKDSDSDAGHAWNIVKIENDYYHIDTTFDMCITEDKHNIRYDYFCLDDSTIKKDRQFKYREIKYIECRATKHEYYRTQKSFILGPSQLAPFFQKNVDRLTNITFRCASGITEQEVLSAYVHALKALGHREFTYTHGCSDVGVYVLKLKEC